MAWTGTTSLQIRKTQNANFLSKISEFKLCITASQMQWTADCTRALQQVKSRGDKKPLKSLKKKQVEILNLGHCILF